MSQITIYKVQRLPPDLRWLTFVTCRNNLFKEQALDSPDTHKHTQASNCVMICTWLAPLWECSCWQAGMTKHVHVFTSEAPEMQHLGSVEPSSSWDHWICSHQSIFRPGNPTVCTRVYFDNTLIVGSYPISRGSALRSQRSFTGEFGVLYPLIFHHPFQWAWLSKSG